MSSAASREAVVRMAERNSGRLKMGVTLRNRVALVTGAVGGIGKAIALHLAQEGATLGLNYLVESDEIAEAFLTEFTRPR